MRVVGGNNVGRFSVDFEVANNDDLALVRHGVLVEEAAMVATY